MNDPLVYKREMVNPKSKPSDVPGNSKDNYTDKGSAKGGDSKKDYK